MNEEHDPWDIYESWGQIFRSAGLWNLSLDYCAKLLAVVYLYGGGDESFTFNRRLLIDTQTAKDRLNIAGAEVPDEEGAELLRHYAKIWKPTKANTPCGWAVNQEAQDFMTENYNIKLRV